MNYDDNTVAVVDGLANELTATVPVGSEPEQIAVDVLYNKIYTANWDDNTVTWIDGQSNTPHTITNIGNPWAIAVNQSTNKVYVTNDYANGGLLTEIDASSNLVTGTVNVRNSPEALAINPVTKRIYVANSGENTVSVIDTSSGHMQVVGNPLLVGHQPYLVVLSKITNMIYVANFDDYTVNVINGANNQVTTINLGDGVYPTCMALNPVTNTLYVGGSDYSVTLIQGTSKIGSLTLEDYPNAMVADPVTNKVYVTTGSEYFLAIDGVTNTAGQKIVTGDDPYVMAANLATDRIYTLNESDNTMSVFAGIDSSPLQWVSITPCRLIDTRNQGGQVTGGTSRDFYLPQLAQSAGCASLSSATVYSLNVTAVPPGRLSYLSVWPSGEDQPTVSTMNAPDGRTKANAAIVPAGYNGGVSVYVSNDSNVILDINGYFRPTSAQTYQFYPLTPCRIVDTRNNNGDLGGPHLIAQQTRDFPLREATNCIPQAAQVQAYSLNLTAIPYPGAGSRLGWLEVWPAGNQPQNPVSTLNNPTGTNVANAAIVPAGNGGNITVLPSHDTHLAIDINGYFGPRSASALSLYPTAPCRVLDTRIGGGQTFQNQLTIGVIDSACGPSIHARAYSFNATVVPTPSFRWLALWPDTQQQPLVSTLNAADGYVTSNMAIVPTVNGKIDAWAQGYTHLILDMSAYFAAESIGDFVPAFSGAPHHPSPRIPHARHLVKK